MSTSTYRGRIAPSPTGYLHLGHAKTFWTAFSRCRKAQGKLLYRDEDIDIHRSKSKFAKAAVEDLAQLGINWEGNPVRQSERLGHYKSALEKLAHLGLIYPCSLSRKKIAACSEAIRLPNGETLFPASLRPEDQSYDPPLNFKINWRFRTPSDQKISFVDRNQGPQTFESQKDFGDFLVWRKEGMPSYELAVVVDDADMQISEVVRGKDLLLSTARQLLIYQAFEWDTPTFYHEDLVKDASGERLAKRKDSLALRTLFKQGHTLESLQTLWEANS